MKLAYLAPIRFPTEKAHGAQIMKSCEAFVRAGIEVSLYVTSRNTSVTDDPNKYYGVSETFSIVRIQTANSSAHNKWGFVWRNVLFGMRANVRGHDAIYCRDVYTLLPFAFFGRIPFFWESHDGSWNIAARFITLRAKGVIVVTKAAKEWYVAHGVSPEKIHVAPNGIDLEVFSKAIPKSEARTRLGISVNTQAAMYIGRLDGWKGVDTLLEATQYFPETLSLYIVGGEPVQLTELSKLYPHVRFLGSRPFKELADVQAAADVLVVPNTGKDAISVSFTSPLKLIAHLASGRPIVASDLPSIREIVDEQSAVLVPADNPKALAGGIVQALEAGEELAASAAERALGFGWDTRAVGILQFIGSRVMV